MDGTINHTAFFHWKYELATSHFDAGELAQADNLCMELVASFVCPRLVQIHALQLRSLCTNDYQHAKSYLLGCFEILDHMPEVYPDVKLNDPVMVERREHTQEMLEDLERAWKETWEKRGLPVPSTEPEATPAASEEQGVEVAMHDKDADAAKPEVPLGEHGKEELEESGVMSE